MNRADLESIARDAELDGRCVHIIRRSWRSRDRSNAMGRALAPRI